jgi:predicted transcriptional regulator
MINDTQKGKANINDKQKGRVVESYKLTVETNVLIYLIEVED